MSYLACDKFVKMSPRERLKALSDKDLCTACIRSGAKKNHEESRCAKNYVCPHSSHDGGVGVHVLLCDTHKHSTENAELLKKFKKDFIEKYSDDLPSLAKNIKINFHSQANFTGTAENEEGSDDRAIFMLQTIDIQGHSFNLFYDSGCGDLCVKKSAIDTLASLGRAHQVLPGPITLSGVGDNKTVSAHGIYNILLPLDQGGDASMCGICLDKVTGKFPTFHLKQVEKEIKQYCRSSGSSACRNLPALPSSVGGETDIMIGAKYLKYFPSEVIKLPTGLTLLKSMFQSNNGTFGIVTGPHRSFTKDWCKMGQVAYFTKVPEVIQYQHVFQLGIEVPLLGWNKSLLHDGHDVAATASTHSINSTYVSKPPKNCQNL